MLLVHTRGLKELTRITNTAVTHQAAEHDCRLSQCPSRGDYVRSAGQEQQALRCQAQTVHWQSQPIWSKQSKFSVKQDMWSKQSRELRLQSLDCRLGATVFESLVRPTQSQPRQTRLLRADFDGLESTALAQFRPALRNLHSWPPVRMRLRAARALTAVRHDVREQEGARGSP